MSGVKKYDYSTLTTAIRDYTEVSSDVLTTTIVDGFIMAAEMRIYQELPMDSERFVQEGTLAANDNTLNAPAGCLFEEVLKYLIQQQIQKVMELG